MRIVALTVLALALATTAQVSAQAPAAPAASAADVNQTLVAVEIEGSKFWLPGTVVAKQGQTVRLTLINKVQSDPNQHGFSILQDPPVVDGDGTVAVPQGPGLGVEINRDLVLTG